MESSVPWCRATSLSLSRYAPRTNLTPKARPALSAASAARLSRSCVSWRGTPAASGQGPQDPSPRSPTVHHTPSDRPGKCSTPRARLPQGRSSAWPGHPPAERELGSGRCTQRPPGASRAGLGHAEGEKGRGQASGFPAHVVEPGHGRCYLDYPVQAAQRGPEMLVLLGIEVGDLEILEEQQGRREWFR